MEDADEDWDDVICVITAFVYHIIGQTYPVAITIDGCYYKTYYYAGCRSLSTIYKQHSLFLQMAVIDISFRNDER